MNVVAGWFNKNVIVPVTDFFRNLKEDVYNLFFLLWDGVKDI